VARVKGISSDSDWLLWLGYASDHWTSRLAAQQLPAVFISERDRTPSAEFPYRSPFVSTRLNVKEAVVAAGLGPNVSMRIGDDWTAQQPRQAARILLDDLKRATES
jgi:hypothetical protein